MGKNSLYTDKFTLLFYLLIQFLSFFEIWSNFNKLKTPELVWLVLDDIAVVSHSVG